MTANRIKEIQKATNLINGDDLLWMVDNIRDGWYGDDDEITEGIDDLLTQMNVTIEEFKKFFDI